MPYLRINGNRLYYEVTGEGPWLVLLHHATASSLSWRCQQPLFGQHFQVLAYDRPGFGRSDGLAPWPRNYHDRDVEDLIALLGRLRATEALLLGHSDGATIALLAAARYPERVRAVVAEAPHVFVETPTCPDGVAQFWQEVQDSPQLQARLARHHGEHVLPVVQRWANHWLDPGFWDWDVSHELPAVGCPVLVVHGAEDSFFSIAHSALVAGRVARGELWVIPSAGHMPHGEVSETFNQRVIDFLRLHSRRGFNASDSTP